MNKREMVRLLFEAKRDDFREGVRKRRGRLRDLRKALGEWVVRTRDDLMWFRTTTVMDWEDRFHR